MWYAEAVVFIIAAIAILMACIGLWRHGEKLAHILYARIHMAGVIDIACIVAMLFIAISGSYYEGDHWLYILPISYFLLMPVASHAVANAKHYMKAEETEE